MNKEDRRAIQRSRLTDGKYSVKANSGLGNLATRVRSVQISQSSFVVAFAWERFSGYRSEGAKGFFVMAGYVDPYNSGVPKALSQACSARH